MQHVTLSNLYAAVEKARKSLRFAEEDYDRAVEQDYFVEQAQCQLDVSKATLDNAIANLNLRLVQLGQPKVRSTRSIEFITVEMPCSNSD